MRQEDINDIFNKNPPPWRRDSMKTDIGTTAETKRLKESVHRLNEALAEEHNRSVKLRSLLIDTINAYRFWQKDPSQNDSGMLDDAVCDAEKYLSSTGA